MVDVGRVHTAPGPTVGLQAQTSQGEKGRKPFNPEILSEEKAAAGVARELAEASSDQAITAPAAASDTAATQGASNQTKESAEWSRSEGAPNWSTLSASSKGYTFTERAITLYRHIHAMPV
ncbi:hypothetical protein [Aliidiomarina soli]|uniref:Uncharacterized protein n=1 Tax=Aliidiomarina soli TaxID=1928574 RepID=A0A432WCA9_9GAMM|nr:hypothetical protein [Aliidiomarina soli]RUO29619.1 hypothetical protein CWE14_14265 [Aliidiomarina soli]